VIVNRPTEEKQPAGGKFFLFQMDLLELANVRTVQTLALTRSRGVAEQKRGEEPKPEAAEEAEVAE